MFQHTAARRRLGLICLSVWGLTLFQHTAARRRLGHLNHQISGTQRFNTQPPEGGWTRFNTRF